MTLGSHRKAAEQMRPWIRLTVCFICIVLQPHGRAASMAFFPDTPNELSFPAQRARFVRFVIVAGSGSQPCIDELEVYGDGSQENLASASRGARAAASSCLPGYAIHRIEHLNDGRYGNRFSWVSAGQTQEWAQIELPRPARLTRVMFSRDREGQYRDRLPRIVEVQLSMDGQAWQAVCRIEGRLPTPPPSAGYVPPVEFPEQVTWEALLRYVFECEPLGGICWVNSAIKSSGPST